MYRIVLIVVVGLLDYVHSGSTLSQSVALTGSEIVWLKDMTAEFQAHKRIFGDPNLPDSLTFRVRRGSGVLTLKLKRNYDIDPNADIYFVQRTKDGRSILSKTTTLEKEAVAYYQDVDNGAYMTVRCMNSLYQQCERIISGNIQIGDRSYDLRLAEADDAAENLLEVTDSNTRRYHLLDQTRLQQEIMAENKDASNISDTHVRWELKTIYRPFARLEKKNDFHLPDETLSQSLANLRDRVKPDTFTDKLRQLKQNYYVKVSILIDSSVWDFYYSKVKEVHPSIKTEEVKRRIREAYTQIINGVNLRYKKIEDEEISISVIPKHFIFFQNESSFPHNRCKVKIENGKTNIEVTSYLHDLSDWDKNIDASSLPEFDHAMLFTMHKLHKGSAYNDTIEGRSYMRGVCDPGKRMSVLQARHYFITAHTAAHELGHNLGAIHDVKPCKPDDFFIMTAIAPHLCKNSTCFKNLWSFSNCSVDSFKRTLNNKECVKHTGSVYDIDEYEKFMKEEPGDVFTPQEQCSLAYGLGSVYYGVVSEDLCYILRCTDPVTRQKRKKYITAARGTKCGENKYISIELDISYKPENNIFEKRIGYLSNILEKDNVCPEPLNIAVIHSLCFCLSLKNEHSR